jgi:hypothetical protein
MHQLSTRLAHLVVISAALSLLGGCSDAGGSLDGSLDSVYDISFNKTRARLYSSQFSVEYVANDGQVPLRVTIDRGEEPIGERSYDLKEHGDVTGQRGDQRIPRFASGKITLNRYEPHSGGRVEGTFNAKFKTRRDTLTLSGTFDTTLEIIEETEGYRFGPDAGDAGEEPGDVEESDVVDQ